MGLPAAPKYRENTRWTARSVQVQGATITRPTHPPTDTRTPNNDGQELGWDYARLQPFRRHRRSDHRQERVHIRRIYTLSSPPMGIEIGPANTLPVAHVMSATLPVAPLFNVKRARWVTNTLARVTLKRGRREGLLDANLEQICCQADFYSHGRNL